MSMPLKYGLSPSYSLPVTMLRAQGEHVYDQTERPYVDLFGGAGRCLVGHANPAVVAAMTEQCSSLIVSRHPHPARELYADLLLGLLPTALDHLAFFSTGSEAVDAAVRMAKAYTQRERLIVFESAFHGRTGSAADLTDPKFLPLGAARPSATTPRCPYPENGCAAEEVDEAISWLQRALGRGDVAALLVEPVQATGGNRQIEHAFLHEAIRICAEHGVLVILDEIVTGFGRTGQMFISACEACTPDMAVIGKGMANGMPVGALVTRREIAAAPPYGLPGGLSSTFGGNPLTVAAALATLRTVLGDHLDRRASDKGAEFLSGLRARLSDHPAVRRVRGTGLLIGVDLRYGVDQVERAFLEAGLLVGVSGGSVRISPPLTISDASIKRSLSLFPEVLGSLVAEERY